MVKAKAIVTVTLEIPADSVWGEETQLEQVHKQAKDDVLHTLSRQLRNTDVKIVATPTVRAVITEEK